MSVNSLSNFGVPGLNGDRGAVLHPIMSNRFRVLFYNFGVNGEVAPYDLTRQIRSVTIPNQEFEEQALYMYVSTAYVATRAEWQTITVRFLDDITNAVASRIENQVAKQQNFSDQTVSRAGENYKFEMDIDILAGGATAGISANDPNIIRRYSLSGCWVKGVQRGELTYETPNGLETEVTIRFDNSIPFNQNGVQLGTFSHLAEIANRLGTLSTGNGIAL